MGLPDIDNKLGTVAATEVTEPEPLLLNVVQSVEDKYPLAEVVATGIPMETALEPLKEVPVRGDEMVRALRFEPNATPEMVELVSEALAIFDRVLVEPEMDLLVSVCEAVRVTTWSVPTWT